MIIRPYQCINQTCRNKNTLTRTRIVIARSGDMAIWRTKGRILGNRIATLRSK